jgi:PAS domain S-box-containing protein
VNNTSESKDPKIKPTKPENSGDMPFPARVINSPIFDDGKKTTNAIGRSDIINERKNAGIRVERSEEWLRNIFETSHDGILVENDEIITYINRSYVQMFGYDNSEELIGQHISVVISAEDRARVTGFGRNRLKGEQSPIKYEFNGRRKDGTLIPVEASVSISTIAEHTYITTIIRDITERRRTEMLIEAQKQSLEMIVKGAPLSEVLVYLAKVVEEQSQGQTAASILLLDKQGRLHNGASPSLTEKYIQAIEGLEADINLGTCSAAAASGQIVITPDIAADPKWNGLAHLPLEQGLRSAWAMPIIARNGHVLGTFGSYFRDCREPSPAELQVVEILGRTVALAIEGKQLEEILRSSENQLRLITDTIPLLISYIDSEERYRFVNQTYTDWFEKSRAKIIGRHISEIMGKEAYQKLLPEIEKVLSGEEVVYEILIPYKSGERFVHANYIPKFDAQNVKVVGFYAFVQDISEQKRIQRELHDSREKLEIRVVQRTGELEKANEARIKVLHQLVTVQEDERQRIARDLHDQLGQQMTALRLKLDVLKNICGHDEEIYKRVEEVQKAARQLDSDVDFLAWQMRPTALDDFGIVAALEYYVRQWSKNFNIPAEFDADRFGKAQLTPEVETNLYRIAQESLNNICKHARASRVNIFLESQDDFAVLIIEDNGIGFERNKRQPLDEVNKGIGLIGMHERAALVGGKIEIESAKNEGTTVYAKFPVSRGE